jgi:putative transposase
VCEQFDLSAQMTVRALAKVGDAYKLAKQTRRSFHPLASIAYDDRILSFTLPASSISIWTLDSGKHRFMPGKRCSRLLTHVGFEALATQALATHFLSSSRIWRSAATK